MVKEEEDDEEKNAAAMTSNSKKSYTAKRTNFTIIKNRRIGPRKHRTKKTQQSGGILVNTVKLGTKLRPNLFRQGVKLGASNLLKQRVSGGTKSIQFRHRERTDWWMNKVCSRPI